MNEARVVQVNVSSGGIPKRAVPEGRLAPTGVEGDRWAHPKIHGGPRQAVLLITDEGLAELGALGFTLGPGALGENLTTRGWDRRAVRVGQQWRVGTAVVQITKLRAPCATLNPLGSGIQAAIFDAAVKAGDWSSPRWGLSGFYAAVVEPGVVRAGDSITLIPSQRVQGP